MNFSNQMKIMDQIDEFRYQQYRQNLITFESNRNERENSFAEKIRNIYLKQGIEVPKEIIFKAINEFENIQENKLMINSTPLLIYFKHIVFILFLCFIGPMLFYSFFELNNLQIPFLIVFGIFIFFVGMMIYSYDPNNPAWFD